MPDPGHRVPRVIGHFGDQLVIGRNPGRRCAAVAAEGATHTSEEERHGDPDGRLAVLAQPPRIAKPPVCVMGRIDTGGLCARGGTVREEILAGDPIHESCIDDQSYKY